MEAFCHIYNSEWRDNRLEGRRGEVRREIRGKHCEMDLLRRRNDLYTSFSPSLSVLDKMFPSSLCNLFVSLALHHFLSKALSSLSPLPVPLHDCLSIKSQQHSISTIHTGFNLLRINCPPQNSNIYEDGHKRITQLFRDLISHVI